MGRRITHYPFRDRARIGEQRWVQKTIRAACGTRAYCAQVRTGVLLVSNDSFFGGRVTQLVTLAARYTIPTVFATREFALARPQRTRGSAWKPPVRFPRRASPPPDKPRARRRSPRIERYPPRSPGYRSPAFGRLAAGLPAMTTPSTIAPCPW